jgi:hypothetical protein
VEEAKAGEREMGEHEEQIGVREKGGVCRDGLEV